MSSLSRLYVESDLADDASVDLPSDQAHYLGRVMRRKVGDPVILFNGRDGEWQARIESLGRNDARLALAAKLRDQPAPSDLWLCFAPLKKAQTDFLVQKATELGVARMQPIFTDRTQSDRVRTDRLLANAREAAEQTERLDLPEIAEPITLDQLLDGWRGDRAFYLCAEAGPAKPIVEAVEPGPAAFVTGPEGGFSPAELDRMRGCSFISPVGLGPRVLRAETAAIAALAVWQTVVGDGGRRPPDRN